VVEGFFRANAAATLADDDGKFRFVVDRLGNFRVDDYRAAAGDH
jgi:hypothetical protein